MNNAYDYIINNTGVDTAESYPYQAVVSLKLIYMKILLTYSSAVNDQIRVNRDLKTLAKSIMLIQALYLPIGRK